MSVYDINRILVPKTPPGFRDDTADAHFVPAPCQVACPVGTDAPSYIAQIWDGNYTEAFEAITATNPFSSICGRVCDAPCEPACRRTDSDGPLQIRNLKRFVMDQVGHRYDPPTVPVTRSETVAIVGAGPAGLTAAHDLCVAGYEVHVYEMTDRLGGMMVWGIPAFRLPPGIIDEDLELPASPLLEVDGNRQRITDERSEPRCVFGGSTSGLAIDDPNTHGGECSSLSTGRVNNLMERVDSAAPRSRSAVRLTPVRARGVGLFPHRLGRGSRR